MNKHELQDMLAKALMDNIPDAIYLKDLKSKFLAVNKYFTEKHEINSPEDAIGKTDFDFFSEEHAGQAFKDEQNIIKTGKPIINIVEKETRADIEDRWVTTTKFPLFNKKGSIVGTFGITRDITDMKKNEDKIKYMSFHDYLTGLYNRAYFEEELNRLSVQRNLPLSIVLGDVNGLKMMNDTYGHEKGDELLIKVAGILKQCFRKSDIISRWGGDEFIILLPLTDCIRAEEIVRRVEQACRQFSSEDMPISIALGISTKVKEDENIVEVLKAAEDKMYWNKTTDEKRMHRSMIFSLEKSLDKKDYETEEHIERMGDLALLLGKDLNLPEDKLNDLAMLAALHDIGKIAVADSIILKPGKLTPEEWELVKKHPEIGYRIVKSSTDLAAIADAILTHHENWDGSGYPVGLKGEEIPLVSRIISIVDSYDAMTNDRPYRKAFAKEQAIAEIRRCSGTKYDPKLVEVFIKIMDRTYEYRK
ncbi:MAG: diguanylate cyclase [Actinobacteria bacterium]|nr:diguanylate cyclase [Actinomycetota bacterium]